jgi:chromosome segregation ATPase
MKKIFSSTLITNIVGILTIAGLLFGGYFFIDSRYALAQTVAQVEKRLDQKIVSDQLDQTQSRIWKLEDRYPKQDKMPESVKEEYRNLQDQKQKLQDKVKNTDQKGQ